MANTQSHTTCHDHHVNPWSVGQRLFSARLTDIIATQIMDAAIAQPYPIGVQRYSREPPAYPTTPS